MHTSDPLREQSVELPVVQKVCESFLFTYCKDSWLIERVVSYVSLPPPPIFSFLGFSFPHPPYLSFSLALVQRGLETEGVPKNQVDCSRLSFLRKTSMC